MKELLSHFQPTLKTIVAYAIAFGIYLGNGGPLPSTPKEWGMAVLAFALTILVPKRAPGANADPDAAPANAPGSAAP